MNKVYKTTLLAGANILAFGVSPQDATVLQPQVIAEPNQGHVQAMTDNQLRQIEASHLEVYAGCKWGHASFEPIKIEVEPLSPQIQAIYSEMV